MRLFVKILTISYAFIDYWNASVFIFDLINGTRPDSSKVLGAI